MNEDRNYWQQRQAELERTTRVYREDRARVTVRPMETTTR